MARILTLSDEHIEYYISRNHRFSKLSPEEREKARLELIEFRDTKRAEAIKRAALLGLHIPEEKMNDFIETYWRMQLDMERRLEAHVRPLRQQIESENLVELQRQFSPRVTRGDARNQTPNEPKQTPASSGSSYISPSEEQSLALLLLLSKE